MVADGCQPQIPVFHGRPGVDLRGEVLPALDGVSITIVADGVSSAGSFKKGDVVMRTSTSNNGVFVAGPLFDDTSYSVKAEKVSVRPASLLPPSQLAVPWFLSSSRSQVPWANEQLASRLGTTSGHWQTVHLSGSGLAR